MRHARGRRPPPHSWSRGVASWAPSSRCSPWRSASRSRSCCLSRAALHSWHPLPGIGPWDEITDWFTHELSSTQIAVVALRVLLCVMWLLWASLLVSVLSSVASMPGRR